LRLFKLEMRKLLKLQPMPPKPSPMPLKLKPWLPTEQLRLKGPKKPSTPPSPQLSKKLENLRRGRRLLPPRREQLRLKGEEMSRTDRPKLPQRLSDFRLRHRNRLMRMLRSKDRPLPLLRLLKSRD
jgi:hypothetical protein